MSEPSHRAWIKLALVAGGIVLLVSLVIWQLFFLNPYRNMTFNQTVGYLHILSRCVAQVARNEPCLLDGSMEDLLEEAQHRNWDEGIAKDQDQNFKPTMQRLYIKGRSLILLTLFDLRDYATKPFATAQLDITNPNRITVKIYGPELYRERVLQVDSEYEHD